MRVIGIDPGTIHTGIGIVEGDGRRFRLVHYGCVKCPSSWHHSRRYQKIYQELSAEIKKHAPQCMAIEDVFFCKNFQSAVRLGEVRGIVMLAGTEAGLPVWEYSPRRIKQSVVGYGNAHKTQVQKMVKQLLSLHEIPEPEDAADALAIALCHLQNASGIMNQGKQV